jgi:hypothetical protein
MMKALRLMSVLSVLPFMIVVDAWTWLEESLARFAARRQENRSWRHHHG